MSEKVKYTCPVNDCKLTIFIDFDAIKQDRYIQCASCGWQGLNENYIGPKKEEVLFP
ncbi:MAG: hypothetical protein IH845_05530 [Nanoarchaeota archaeon]|nr:hypothetical protein [Nanoarchaeota archaeon]